MTQAEAPKRDPGWKPTRVPFAVAALDEFAEAGVALLLPLPIEQTSEGA